MPLKGKAPSAIEKRFKCFLYGPAGVGKTTASIQFPRPYLIDTERGAENDSYVKLLKESKGAYYFSNDFDDITGEVKTLMTEKHQFQTVIIDPITVPYNDMADKEAQRLAAISTDPNSDGSEFGRNRKNPDRKVRHLINLLLRVDMNVIMTAHAKTKWEKSGTSFKEAGMTFDGYTKLDYIFDLVVEVQKRGTELTGIVRKSRIATFKDGESFQFSYAEIAKRYGEENLTRAVKVEKLASKEQITELVRLIDVLHIPPEKTDKWLDKAQAENWAEMPDDSIQKCIDHLKSQISNEKDKSDAVPA
jgi:hypothetical protein